MDVSTYIRPNTKNFIEGYDLLRTFLSETKSRFASDSIEDTNFSFKSIAEIEKRLNINIMEISFA